MEMQVAGKLKTANAKEPSFKGFRIEALFDCKPVPTSSPPRTSRPLTADPFRVSALSDDAGNFTLAFPDPREIATETVKLAVVLPAGRVVREMELMRADLGQSITIEVETLDAGVYDQAPPEVDTPQGVVVDALFRTDVAVRRAITQNLKSLRGESEAIAARVDKAWKFNPSQLSAEELARRHHVEPGSDPGEVLERVIMSGVHALRSAGTERALTLRNGAELKKLIKNNQELDGSLRGVVELGPLIELIQRQGAGPFVGAEPTSTRYRAEAEADAILDAIGNGERGGNG